MRPALLDRLGCPVCGRTRLGLDRTGATERLLCTGCGRRFPVRHGIPILLPDDLQTPDLQGPGSDSARAGLLREMALRDRESGCYDALFPDDKYAAELETYQRLFAPPAGARVLDLGCGTGRVTRHLLATGARFVGADLSLESLRFFAQRLSPAQRAGVDLVQAEAGRLPFAPESFDWVVCLSMVGQLPGAGLRDQALAEIERVLAPRGWLLVSLHNFCLLRRASGWLRLSESSRKQGTKSPLQGGIHYYNHTPREARAWLEPRFEIHALAGVDNHVPVLHRLSAGFNALLDRALTRTGLSLSVFAREMVILARKRQHPAARAGRPAGGR